MRKDAGMTDVNANTIAALRAEIAEKPDGVLEALAERHQTTMKTVFSALPEGQATPVPASRFEDLWADLATWGDVTFIVHTRDGVFETKAPVPPGSHGRGYFNIHGDSPLGGHIRADRCDSIWFVDRPFFGRRSCSLVFINTDGEAMFKVFVGRDAQRELNPQQIARFEALRASLA
ncbi:hypothetical protein EV666_11287 [Camelimonas lactis]|uniref:Heme utilization protein HuvX n=2 Tax=Camelimonas lactis TaxID=659006 RepID=A0A4R2GPK1_9HYPH|nr:hypothetical protein EV666_11287 [Camelimonas lactis]